MRRNPDRELDGTNTEDFPTGEAGRWCWARIRVDVTPSPETPAVTYDTDQPSRRTANVRRTAESLRAFLRFLGLLALVMGLIFGLLVAADRLLPSTTRPTTTAIEGPG